MTEEHDVNPAELVQRVIDQWCSRRELHALSVILPGYLAVNGLTDGWAELLKALDSARMFYSDLPDDEVRMLQDARSAIHRALRDR